MKIFFFLVFLLVAAIGFFYKDDIINIGNKTQETFLEAKQNTIDSYNSLKRTVEETQVKIEETQEKIEEKKAQFDQKLQDIKDAQAALDKLFGNKSPSQEVSLETEKKLEELQNKIKELESEKTEISKETQQLEKNLEKEETVLKKVKAEK